MRSILLLTTAPFVLLSTPALSLTAEEAFADITQLFAMNGQPLECATPTKSGGMMVVDDCKILIEVPAAEVDYTFSSIELKENGDGSVAASFPDDLVYSVTGDGSAPMPAFTYVVSVDGALILAGEPGRVTYTATGNNVTWRIDEATLSEGGFSKLDGMLSGLTGQVSHMGGDMTNVAYDFAGDAFTFNVVGSPNTVALDISGRMEKPQLTSTGTMGSPLNNMNMLQSLKDGLAVDGTFGHAGAQYKLKANDPRRNMNIMATSDSGAMTFGMSEAGLTYGAETRGSSITVTDSNLPFGTIGVAADLLGFDMTFPIAGGTDPQPYAYALDLSGVTISENIWSMVDPQAAVPRDPATIALDVSGTMVWDFSLLDPEMLSAAPSDFSPPNLIDLVVNTLSVSFGGAAITGDGQFAFVKDMFATGDFPVDTGTANFKLNGVYGLLDKLTAANLLPPQQAMGARMGLGIAAKPTENADELVSEIVIAPGRVITVNGQRMPF